MGDETTITEMVEALLVFDEPILDPQGSEDDWPAG